MLAGSPVGQWIGQDGSDVVGTSQGGPPNLVQDMHFSVSNLPVDRAVLKAVVYGYGGGQWQYNTGSGGYPVGWVQAAGSSSADFYLEPYMVETGRQFTVYLEYGDRTSSVFTIQGGAADPNLWVAGTRVDATWSGQLGLDLTGPDAGVGPDGLVDVQLALSNLIPGLGIVSIDVATASGLKWSYGQNPGRNANAELVRAGNQSTTAYLYLNPADGMANQELTVSVRYSNGKTNQTTLLAGIPDLSYHTNQSEAPGIQWGLISGQWNGQDGLDLTGTGDVHISLAGLPVDRSVISVTLTNVTSTSWIYLSGGGSPTSVDPYARELAFRRATTDLSRADLTFQPMRNESGSALTLRLLLDDGTNQLVRVTGGEVDLGLLGVKPDQSEVVARPGDSIADYLQQAYGTIHLTAGTYLLDRPLSITRPVSISADSGVTLLFNQPADATPWTTAINIACGNVSLDGFAVRFDGPVRWTTHINTGPSIIGNSDQLVAGYKTPPVNIRLTHLDLEVPAPSSTWEEAPRVIWMAGASNGVIANNILRGGPTEFYSGPWQITGNRYLGTLPNTFSAAAFAGHFTRDLTLANNTVEPVGPSGKTWRFLVLTEMGYNDVVRDNFVRGIGPMDNDAIPHPNAPELILTEAYHIKFEGDLRSVSSDGWVVQIPPPQGSAPRVGDVVSVLNGPEAGQYRRITQVLNSTSFVLDAPISLTNRSISISSGFVNERFLQNTIDARGSSISIGFVMVGNNFGTQIVGNHLSGGSLGLKLTAAPSESPVMWGWTHAPYLGGVVAGNTFEDVARAGDLDVELSEYIKRSIDRTYMTISLTDNTIVWSDAFLAQRAQAGLGLPETFRVGNPELSEPESLELTASGNAFQGPANLGNAITWKIYAALYNNQASVNQEVALPEQIILIAPEGITLVNDSGVSDHDQITNDARIRFIPFVISLYYEYSLTGQEGSFLPVTSFDGFLPDQLAQGANTVSIRAVDSRGNRGPSSQFTFEFDNVAPITVSNLIAKPTGEVDFDPTGLDDLYEYWVDDSETRYLLARSTAFTLPEALRESQSISVHAIDLAGNAGLSSTVYLDHTTNPDPEPNPKPEPEPGPNPRPQPEPPADPTPEFPSIPDPDPLPAPVPQPGTPPQVPLPSPPSVIGNGELPGIDPLPDTPPDPSTETPTWMTPRMLQAQRRRARLLRAQQLARRKAPMLRPLSMRRRIDRLALSAPLQVAQQPEASAVKFHPQGMEAIGLRRLAWNRARTEN